MSVLLLILGKMIQNISFRLFREKLFSKKLKKESSKTAKEDIDYRPRSSSICSINFPASEDIVEESIAQGLPIIPFGFPTFVIEEEELCNTAHKAPVNKSTVKTEEIKTDAFKFPNKGVLEEPKCVSIHTRKEREKTQTNWNKANLKPPQFPRTKHEKMKKTKSVDLKFNIFGSGDMKNAGGKGDQWRTFTKKDEYMFLDYSNNIKTRNNLNLRKKGGTL